MITINNKGKSGTAHFYNSYGIPCLLDPGTSRENPVSCPVPIPAGAVREFSSPGSTFCADSYFGICSTPVLSQSHVKDPGHSAKSAGGRLQLNTHAPYICGFA